MAPADPSPKDHQVAARARGYMMAAQLELAQQQSEMDDAREGVNDDRQQGSSSLDATSERPAAAADTNDSRGAGPPSAELALSRYDTIARAGSAMTPT
ncbi:MULTISPECIES: hypothetical protein [unclassified Halomonas]|uniref:hypothetical protein n=1 Tax=unclassified Halomonas TaxID=2609666 RepID=UPI00288864A9|nr:MULTISPECIES: hypothetical protein [unclassified Halomonas]MDT0500484.1 hypothetical protein [Halomonas sp. PAR7]MDT0511620.1 hypothetical protein [Halomonas sp. LES1]MDT0590092.1 hypothetical protein [Halomonas sp. PAR8]